MYLNRFSRHLLVAIALLCAAQLCTATVPSIDIPIGVIGPYSDLARSVTWGDHGHGGVQNAYIFTPLSPERLTCVYIANNNPTSAHTFTLTFYYTGDPTIASFYGPGSGGASTQSHWKIVNTIADTVIASGINNYSFSSPGAARAVVDISEASTQTGTPDTADVYIVQTTTNCGTATVNVNAQSSCANSVTNAMSSGALTLIIAAPPTGQFIHVCAISLTYAGTLTGGATTLGTSASGSCSTQTLQWQVFFPPGTAPAPYTIGNGTAQLFQTLKPAQPLCAISNTGNTTAISLSYFIG